MSSKKKFATGLKIVPVKNVIITKPLVIKKIFGIDRNSIFDSIDMKTRIKWDILATVSIFKNRLSFWKDDNYYYLFNVWAVGYYHWLVEVAIKFALFEKELKEAVIIIPERSPAFVKSFLSLAGIEKYRTMKGSCFVRNVKVITNPVSGYPNPEHIKTFRKYVLDRLPSTAKTFDKIYISRKLAARRKVLNEEDVMKHLEAKGFYCVQLEIVPWIDQVSLFSRCRELVSIHGAGLTNLIFMPAGSSVTEIYLKSDAEVNPCFVTLCEMLSIEHRFLFAQREKTNTRPDFHQDNVNVNIRDLKMMIGEDPNL